MVEQQKQKDPAQKGTVIAGRNAVQEALRAGRAIDSVYVARGTPSGTLSALVAKARKAGAVIKEADPRKLDFLCGGANHQGIVAMAAAKEYASLDDLFTLARQREEPPFFVILDGIEDPHNLGAILRTAECAGAHGIIIPRRRAVGLTYAVGKASAGAVEYLPVARVTNLADAADMDGKPWCTVDYTGPAALVIGKEGAGISRLVKEKADFTVSLPLLGNIQSLNASVACGVLCYEIARQRQGLPVWNKN